MFTKLAEDRRERAEKIWTRLILDGNAPIDQSKVDYERGYWFAIRQVVDGPEKAVKSMERSEVVHS